jgi:hypothetical protein
MPKMTETVRQQATAIAQSLQAQVERIDRDPNLSHEGKRLAAAKTCQARDQMGASSSTSKAPRPSPPMT